jgi:hypothetical protein
VSNNLIHIVYVSFASRDLKEEDLDDFLVNIRQKNKEYGITGLLLYNNGSFIQVIEGKKETIQNLFSVIKNDSRHNNVVMLHEEQIKQRDFPDWCMGYKKLSNRKSSKIPGFSDYMNSENPEKTIKNSTKEIMDLLESFRQHT